MSKQRIASTVLHPSRMPERRPINDVLAANLRHFMARSADLQTQQALAARSGVSQRTISNYLNPENRSTGSRGKAPSAKLTEIERVARALGVEVWHLLRPTTPVEIDLWENVERLYESMRDNASRQMPLVLHEPDAPGGAAGHGDPKPTRLLT